MTTADFLNWEAAHKTTERCLREDLSLALEEFLKTRSSLEKGMSNDEFAGVIIEIMREWGYMDEYGN